MNKIFYSKKEQEIIKKYFPIGGSKLVKRYLKNRTIDSIFHKANRMKIKCSKESRVNFDEFIYKFNKNSSYLLGLIWGDGNIYITKNKYSSNLSISLQEDDFNELMKYNLFDKFNIYKIKKTNKNHKNQCKAMIGHRKLVNFLKENDFYIKSKTSPYKILNLIPINLHPYFYRGWFDADGCCTMLNKNRWVINIAGSYNQDWGVLKSWCEEKLIKFFIIKTQKERGSGSVFQIQGIRNVNIFMKFIYCDNEPCLSRKYLCYINAKINLKNKYAKSGSKYIGVSKTYNNKYRVRVNNNGKQVWVGVFKKEDDAAIAFNRYIIENKIKKELNEIGKDFFLE